MPLLINVVTPELEHRAFLDPFLDWNGMEFADTVNKPQCCRIAHAHIQMVETSIHLQYVDV